MNKKVLDDLMKLEEVNLSNLSNGNDKVRPRYFGLIKDSLNPLKRWELVGIAGKVTSEESLKKFTNYQSPFIIASNEFDEYGNMSAFSVSTMRNFRYIEGYVPLGEIPSNRYSIDGRLEIGE